MILELTRSRTVDKFTVCDNITLTFRPVLFLKTIRLFYSVPFRFRPFGLTGQESTCINDEVRWNGCGMKRFEGVFIRRCSLTAWDEFECLTSDRDVQRLQETAYSAL